MTTDNRTNEPNQNETKSGQTFCFTEAQVEAAAKAYPRWIVDHDGPETPWEQESDALKNEYRAMMRAALVAAAGAAPQAESGDPWLDAAGNEAQRCLRCGKYVFECCESFAQVQPSSTVDEAFERAKLTIEGVHQVHGVECLCGFKSNRSRSRTEHITHALKAEWLKEQGR